MVKFLTESDVHALLTMEDAIHVLDSAIREHGNGEAMNQPRQRVAVGSTTLHVLPASIPSMNSLGLKAYTTSPNGARFWLLLFAGGGDLKAIIEADRLGQVRTGAASGVATKYLSNENSSVAGVIGTGFQARTQLEAVCAVRPIKRVRAWSRTRENVERYCREMTELLDVPVEPATSAEDAVRDADIVITMTSANEPVLKSGWIKDGTHLNVAGSNKATNREIDSATLSRAAVVVTDDHTQAQVESGDLIAGVDDGVVSWNGIRELSEVVAGRIPGRRSQSEVTLFKSHGVGLWDIAVAAHVFRLSEQRGIGDAFDMASGPDPTRV